MKPRAPRVAVIGVDSPIGLTVIRELGESGARVIALGRSAHALGRASRHTAEFAVLGAPLAAWLPGFVRERRIDAVMAISEGYLIELAALHGQLGACRLLTPTAERLERVLDKQRTLALAARCGLRVPHTWQPRAGDDLGAGAAALAYPVAVKWADPNAVGGALAAAGLALEKVEYARGPAELSAILARYAPLGAWPLVQQWCPGYGLGQMLHMHRGVATLRFQHRRLREFPPSGGVSSFCAAVPLAEHRAQFALSEALLRELDWEGPAMVEYRHDPATGAYWLMEVNGRFWGSIPLAYHCGAHFAREAYRCGVIAPAAAPLPPQGPSRMRRARYVIPDAKRIAMVLRDAGVPRARRARAGLRFLLDFFDPRVRYYVWSWRDPAPFFADLRAGLARLIARGGRRSR